MTRRVTKSSDARTPSATRSHPGASDNQLYIDWTRARSRGSPTRSLPIRFIVYAIASSASGSAKAKAPPQPEWPNERSFGPYKPPTFRRKPAAQRASWDSTASRPAQRRFTDERPTARETAVQQRQSARDPTAVRRRDFGLPPARSVWEQGIQRRIEQCRPLDRRQVGHQCSRAERRRRQNPRGPVFAVGRQADREVRLRKLVTDERGKAATVDPAAQRIREEAYGDRMISRAAARLAQGGHFG